MSKCAWVFLKYCNSINCCHLPFIISHTVVDKKSSRFFSVQRNATEGKCQWNGNATESLTFHSCNSLEPQMLYLMFNSTFPSLPPGAKTLWMSNSYLVFLFSYSRQEVHAQFFVSVCRSYRNITT